MAYPLRTIQEDGQAVVILDQTRLPRETAFVRLTNLEEAAHAIRVMQVRGAPLIGATAAYGVALGLLAGADDGRLAVVLDTLGETRPTAVNLHWALARMKSVLAPLPATDRCAAAWREARAIAREDEAANAAIGRNGLPLIAAAARKKGLPPAPLPKEGGDQVRQAAPVQAEHAGTVNIMTHCNAGWLATVAHGTAISPIYAAHAAGIPVHVWVSETRPRNQGLLTAWELEQAGIPYTLIADNAAGLLMMQDKVDCVIVGADRIAANGDTANKVGTYLKALACKAHGVPFYVAAPVSTIDFACPAGTGIPIEERSAAELGVSHMRVANPAFDVTPAGLIAGIITEHDLRPADQLAGLKP
ncbi:MAG: S-methyl-5-thioribose-1-phosphate isomerase [Sterolibacteriaceae bacterium MAG5]|nr:S-methyl-5-thioribose-1-phosphate isomerase [Candidatus Nitricoxidireducens bremensis]